MKFLSTCNLLSILFLAACTHAQITPFQKAKVDQQPQFTPTNPSEIGIYRTYNPYSNFIELGLISLDTNSLDLNWIYNQLRTDAAEVGAEAIIDLHIHSETHTETHWQDVCSPQTSCTGDGNCTTNQSCHSEMVTEEKSSFLTEGSMIRRKQ